MNETAIALLNYAMIRHGQTDDIFVITRGRTTVACTASVCRMCPSFTHCDEVVIEFSVMCAKSNKSYLPSRP